MNNKGNIFKENTENESVPDANCCIHSFIVKYVWKFTQQLLFQKIVFLRKAQVPVNMAEKQAMEKILAASGITLRSYTEMLNKSDELRYKNFHITLMANVSWIKSVCFYQLL